MAEGAEMRSKAEMDLQVGAPSSIHGGLRVEGLFYKAATAVPIKGSTRVRALQGLSGLGLGFFGGPKP